MALGVAMFNRVDKLESLLNSVNPDQIHRVIIADNGEQTEAKHDLYRGYDSTDLTVIDVKYNAGLGRCRERICDELREDLLLIVDSDIVIPGNIESLAAQVTSRQDIGGVGGILWENSQLRSNCFDLHEQGDVLLKHISGSKRIAELEGDPFVEFDLIQNVAVFKRECLMDYSWDPAYKIGWEHADFFLGHMRNTEWSFGVNPNVIFRHQPGGGSNYMRYRNSSEELRKSKEYFLRKWGYSQVLRGQCDWLQSADGLPSIGRLFEQFAKHALLSSPPIAQTFSMNMLDKVREVRGMPPL
jgi:hypothetical protein